MNPIGVHLPIVHKLGVHMMVWSGSIDADALARLPRIKTMGYETVEFPILDPFESDAATVRASLADAGLACTTSTAFPEDFNLLDEEVRPATVAWLGQVIHVAAKLGAPILCGPMAVTVGERRGRGPTAAEWDSCVRGLREAGAIAADAGVTLAFEPLNRFESFIATTTADAVRLVEEVDSPAVGLLLDTFHMHIEEKSTPEAIRLAGKHLRHFHASENDRGVVGSGQVPWAEVCRTLREVGYDGQIVVESFNAFIPNLSGATCIWRPLADSPDALARESAQFLREICLH